MKSKGWIKHIDEWGRATFYMISGLNVILLFVGFALRSLQCTLLLCGFKEALTLIVVTCGLGVMLFALKRGLALYTENLLLKQTVECAVCGILLLMLIPGGVMISDDWAPPFSWVVMSWCVAVSMSLWVISVTSPQSLGKIHEK